MGQHSQKIEPQLVRAQAKLDVVFWVLQKVDRQLIADRGGLSLLQRAELSLVELGELLDS